MRWLCPALLLALAAASALSYAVVSIPLPQAAASSNTPQNRVVLTKLSSPIYPPLARRMMISGDVNLSLGIRRDGGVESAVIASGHPLLQQAALESAQQSKFLCQGCTDATTPYSLVYTFQLVAPDCHAPTSIAHGAGVNDEKSSAQVSQSQNHVTVMDEGGICEGVFAWKVRSAKCFYLWKCGWRM